MLVGQDAGERAEKYWDRGEGYCGYADGCFLGVSKYSLSPRSSILQTSIPVKTPF